MKALLILTAMVTFAPASAQALGLDDAMDPGINSAMGRRSATCIDNDLRADCEGKGIGDDRKLRKYFLDWDPGTKRCFVVTSRPTDKTITGGGPFTTLDAARTASKTTKGCQP
jgi:hypothetical protein